MREATKRAIAEAKEIRTAKDVYDDICKEMAKNFGRSKSYAYARYAAAMLENANALISPQFLDAIQHMKLVNEAMDNVKSNEGSSQEDPRELMAAWLRGDKDLTRIPFEKIQ